LFLLRNKDDRDKNTCGVNAVATIKRSDFGVDHSAPTLADTVNIVLQIEVTNDRSALFINTTQRKNP
jgi:polyisoprenoid-binding protein YceI